MLRKMHFMAMALMLLLSQPLFASHMLGYDMELINIKDANNNPTDTYKWRLRFYRDVTGAPIPSSFSFTIFRNTDNSSAGNFTVTKVNPQTFLSYAANLCVPIPMQNRVELGIYESTVQNYSALNATTGYYASSNHCCRNTGIVNVQGSSDSYGMLMFVEIPRLNAGAVTRYNSTPKFKELPLSGFSLGKQYSIDWSATDADGDSLVYSFVNPLDGGPVKSSFANINFPAGYSLGSNIADGSPDVSINSATGIITYKPTIANKYLLAVKVEEYRNINGVPTKIGEVRREMQIQTVITVDQPPKLYDAAPNTTKIDTITVNGLQTKVLEFISDDHPLDSVFIKIIPEPGALSNNILDTTLIDAAWADSLGNSIRGTEAEQFIISAKRSALARLTIKADSNSVSIVPYKFKIVSYDQTCFTPLADTLNYILYVLGNPCYNTVTSIVTACDSFVSLNGTVYYQSTTFRDTMMNVVGCHVVNIQNIDIIPSPTANFDNVNIYVTDTTQMYTYKVDTQSNVLYQWTVSSNGSIVSGFASSEVKVKWNIGNSIEQLTCYLIRGNCFDSTSSPIVVSHILGLNNLAINKINVYPNPVNDVMMFNTSDKLEGANIRIYNTLGQEVLKNRLTQNELKVTTLPQGIYNFNISIDGINYRGKFIKK